MKKGTLEYNLLETAGQPTYFSQSLISVMDPSEDGKEYLLNIEVIATSAEAAQQYLENIKSDRFPHVAWYSMQAQGEEGVDNGEPQINLENLTQTTEIISAVATLVPGETDGSERTYTIETSRVIPVRGTERFRLRLRVDGSISVSIEQTGRPLMTRTSNGGVFRSNQIFHNRVNLLAVNGRSLPSQLGVEVITV